MNKKNKNKIKPKKPPKLTYDISVGVCNMVYGFRKSPVLIIIIS